MTTYRTPLSRVTRGIQRALQVLHAGYVVLLGILSTGPATLGASSPGPRPLLGLRRPLGLLQWHAPQPGRVEQTYARDIDSHAQRCEGAHLGAGHVAPRHLRRGDAEAELLRKVEQLHLHTQRASGGRGWRASLWGARGASPSGGGCGAALTS